MRGMLIACACACAATAIGCGGTIDGGGDLDAPSGSDPALVACVTETNMYRQMNGKPPVAESAKLEAYAATGAMVDFDSSPHDHFTMTSGGGIAFAENECPQQGNWNLSFGNGDLTQTVIACVTAFYDEGPGTDYATHGHYINMMGDYGSLGCGIYLQGQQLTIVQDYGR